MDQTKVPGKIGRPCTICAHADLSEIDAGIIAGTPIARLSRDHGVSADSVRRHIRSHLAPEARQALRGAESLSTSDLISRVADVADSARDARLSALDDGERSVALRAGTAEVRALEALFDRLGVDDLEVLDQLRDGERLATAVGIATRVDPALGRAIASRLRALGADEMATALEGHALSSETQLSKAVHA